jgi:hypothetical protein
VAPITTYMPAPDGSGRTIQTILYDDGHVQTLTLPVVKRGMMRGTSAGGEKLEHGRGVDTGSLGRGAR